MMTSLGHSASRGILETRKLGGVRAPPLDATPANSVAAATGQRGEGAVCSAKGWSRCAAAAGICHSATRNGELGRKDHTPSQLVMQCQQTDASASQLSWRGATSHNKHLAATRRRAGAAA
jgi:hypothetical protein